jgi:hypothetical protein
MKYKFMISLTLSVLALFSLPAIAQENTHIYTNQKTDIPEDARYEFVQSTLAAKATLKFDRFTGNTYQIVMRADSSLTWQRIDLSPHSGDVGQNKGKVNYQLFLSGLAMRFTFLMNIRSGAVWQLVTTSTDDLIWEPIE